MQPGTRLGPYEVTAQIGAGGICEVYCPRHSHQTTARTCNLLRLLLISFVVVTFLPASGWAGGCDWCKRTVVVKANSLTDPSFTTEAALAWLAPLLSSSCVSVKAFGTEPKPEYILVVRFEGDPNGKFPNLNGTFSKYGEIRDAGSIMTIVLFGAFGHQEAWKEFGAFGREVPDYGCLVESASTEDKGLSWQAHKSLMMAQLGKVLPLETFLRHWENTPASVQIRPQKEDLNPGEEIDIRITDFRDKSGRPMNTECNKNRVLFKAEKGKILNTEVSLGTVEDPRLLAYPVNNIGPKAEYVIKYKAPDDRCSEDTILVYNSCDILLPDVLPLEQTRKKDLIGKKTVHIGCRWDFTITLTHELSNVTKTSDGISQCLRDYSMTLKGRVHFVERSSQQDRYESDAVNIELKDTYQRHSDYASQRPAPDRKFHTVWIADKSGQVPLKVTLTIIHIQPAWYSISWTDLGGDPVHYKGGFQWEGLPQTPDGASEFTYDITDVIHTTLPPKEVCQYKEGQTVLQGDFSTHDLLLLLAAFPDPQIVRPDDRHWGRVPPLLAKVSAGPEFMVVRAPIITGHADIKWEFRSGQ